MIDRDSDRYAALLRAMAALSGLFSENSAPYIDSRFIERLFVATTNSIDIGRTDKSFDAVTGDIGVGVKTFLGGNGNSKREKVAEFTSLARQGKFSNLTGKNLVVAVANARNLRVLSDANELGLSMEKCVYHCLVRFSGGAIVHEEPYGLIDVDNLYPTDRSGQVVNSWPAKGRGVFFTDGKSAYSFSTAKNVLFKRFEYDRNKNFIPLEIRANPLDLLGEMLGTEVKSSLQPVPSAGTSMNTKEFSPSDISDLVPGVDYVVLPLYSPSSGEVPEKSGINQWNAGGRVRKFGEAYISIPQVIHRRFPDFFPSRDVKFPLMLPNSHVPQSGKVCQDGSKALMTDPNNELGIWLVSVLDPSIPISDFSLPPKREQPFSYDDLIAIGKDSVKVKKIGTGSAISYAIEFAALDSYEEFIAV